ncbi:hypothetical protein [Vagococcus sp. WN89Y]|uniref:hypothetical protein n=1 Tax=Vagococcus sp. WN89Y TaxID=3457258 RepID=UPI003FCC502C
MKYIFATLALYLVHFSTSANCFVAPGITLWQQLSYRHKDAAIWRIAGKKTYTDNNAYNDMAINLSNNCTLIDSKLEFLFSAYALIYSSWRDTGSFETDQNISRTLIDKLSLAYNFNEKFRFEGGKLKTDPGVFFLKSPAKLINTSYNGFKPTRLYDTEIRRVYEESFWGGSLSTGTSAYALTFTAAAKFAKIEERYQTSGDWSAAQRSNARERYLLSWTDYRQANHTPSVHFMAGDSPGVAFADTFEVMDRVIVNAEFAMHCKQQWRHFSPASAERIRAYDFSRWLYREHDINSFELALGVQYTTDKLNSFGMEYYFQSEGYSEASWKKQIDFIKYLNTSAWNSDLANAYDNYKYLMAAEINNTINQGMLQKRHYIYSYANIIVSENLTVQPWLILNIQDSSAMLGIHTQIPLSRIDERLEMWSGIYATQGRKNSEFALFGEALNIYLGFKYFL